MPLSVSRRHSSTPQRAQCSTGNPSGCWTQSWKNNNEKNVLATDLRESECYYWSQPILFSLPSVLLLASGVLTRSIVISRVNTSLGGINQQHLLCQFMATANIDHSDMCCVQRNRIQGQHGKLQHGWGLQSICFTNQLHNAINGYFCSHNKACMRKKMFVKYSYSRF